MTKAIKATTMPYKFGAEETKPKKNVDENNVEYEECFVANIIGNHYWGKEKILRSGTKEFKAGTKVYCQFGHKRNVHIQSGERDYRVVVLGRAKNSFRMIEVYLNASLIKNIRIEKVYKPRIIFYVRKHKSYLDLGLHQNAEYIIDTVNSNHMEIAVTDSTPV